jgi:hypothetical protein
MEVPETETKGPLHVELYRGKAVVLSEELMWVQ